MFSIKRMSIALLVAFMAAFLVICTQSFAATPSVGPESNGKGPIYPTAQDEKSPARGKLMHHDTPPAQLDFIPPPLPPMGVISSSGYGGFKYAANGAAFQGIMGDLSAMTDTTLSDSTPPKYPLIFPGTFRYPGACLEAGVVNFIPANLTYTAHAFYTYDWCGPGAGGDGTGSWQSFTYTDNAAWRLAYTTTQTWASLALSGQLYYDNTIHVRVWKTGVSPNCAEADIWNYSTGVYDIAATSCGTDTSPVAGGWSVFETHYWDSSPFPPCGWLSSFNIAQARSMKRYSTTFSAWYAILARDVQDTYMPSESPTGVCLGWHPTTYPWYFRNAGLSGTYTGADWSVCGPNNYACRP